MHKPKVDTRSENHEKAKDSLQKLRAENRQLRKQLKIIKKELQRSISQEAPVFEEVEDLLLESPEETPKNLTCRACKKHDVQEIDAGLFLIHKCNDCGARKAHKKT